MIEIHVLYEKETCKFSLHEQWDGIILNKLYLPVKIPKHVNILKIYPTTTVNPTNKNLINTLSTYMTSL